MPLVFTRRRPRRAGAPPRRVRPVGPGQPAEGAAARAAAAASCSGSPRARGCDDRDVAESTSSRDRRGRRRRVVAGRARGRTGRSAARSPPARLEVHAPAGVVGLRARRHDRDRRRGHDRAPSSTDVLGGARSGVRARSARPAPRPSAGCSRRPLRAPPAAATARCATGCSRCASSPPTGGVVKGGGPDGEERDRLRPAPPARRFARHARRARAGHAALPAAAGDRRAGPSTDADPRRLRRPPVPAVVPRVGRRARRTCCSRGIPADVDAERARRAGLEPRRRPRRAPPTGAHRGRISVAARRARRARAASCADADGVRWLAEVASARCTSPPTRARRSPRARAVGRGRRRLAAARGGRARARRVRRRAAEPAMLAARARPRSTRPASCSPGRLPLTWPRDARRRDAQRERSASTRTSSSRASRAGCACPQCPTYRVTGLETAVAARAHRRDAGGAARRRADRRRRSAARWRRACSAAAARSRARRACSSAT